MNIELTPDPDEIVQAEEPEYNARPIPVSACGPVETRELPAVRAAYKTEQGVGATVAIKLLSLEPRRKKAVIMSDTEPIYISGTQAGAQAGLSGAFLLPADTAFTIDHMDQVWVCATQNTTNVSVMTSFWSE